MDTKIKRQIQSFFGGSRALQCVEDWTFVKVLGNGSGGIVYSIQKDMQTRVVKYLKKTSKIDALYEIAMQCHFYNLGLAPQVFAFDSWDNFKNAVIIMEPIEVTLETFLKVDRSPKELDVILQLVTKLITKLCENKIRHNDLHWGNLAMLNGNLVCIDFGESSIGHRYCFDYIEWFQLARTLPKGPNKDYLFEKIVEKLNKSVQKVKTLVKENGDTDIEMKNFLQVFETTREIKNEDDLNMIFINNLIQPMRPKQKDKEQINFSPLDRYQFSLN